MTVSMRKKTEPKFINVLAKELQPGDRLYLEVAAVNFTMTVRVVDQTPYDGAPGQVKIGFTEEYLTTVKVNGDSPFAVYPRD